MFLSVPGEPSDFWADPPPERKKLPCSDTHCPCVSGFLPSDRSLPLPHPAWTAAELAGRQIIVAESYQGSVQPEISPAPIMEPSGSLGEVGVSWALERADGKNVSVED